MMREGRIESKEAHESMEIVSRFDIIEVRHGDRTVQKPDGSYTGGEELTTLADKTNKILAGVIAQRPEYKKGNLQEVDVIGSTIRSAREKDAGELGRASKTAEAFAMEIGKNADTINPTIEADMLSYKIMKTQPPYRHERYNEVFQEVRRELAAAHPAYDADKLNDLAGDVAQNAIANDFTSLLQPKMPDGTDNPQFAEATAYARECAGAHAYLIMHYVEKLRKGDTKTNGLAVIGQHGPTLELLLKYALVRTVDGKKIVGFNYLAEIGSDPEKKSGGHQHVSESFTFSLQKMSDGSIQCPVRFNDPSKFGIGSDLHLDLKVVKELADEFKSDSLHPELAAASKELGTEYGAIDVKL